MKKSLIVLLAVAALALWGGAAQAAISGTSHALTNAAGGFCAACHIPHAAGGSRLWVKNPISGTVTPGAYVGSVAPLCGYCHYSNMGGRLPDAVSNAYVYDSQSHGQYMRITITGHGGILPYGHVASGLPYMTAATDGIIECTTCHDVHDDTKRPFLRANLNEFCSMCHGFRRADGGVWRQGTGSDANVMAAWQGTYTGDNNIGSHPVGTDITGNVYNGGSPIVFPAQFAVGVTDMPDNWTLGGHRTAGQTGGVSCVTCHAVHGIQYDSSGPGQGITQSHNLSPNFNFLVVEQGTQSISGERSIANGSAYANGLCEACHDGPIDGTYGASNTPNPNPGATSWGHPVDDMAVVGGADWVTAFPTNWPAGPVAGYTASDSNPVVICESCHVTHAFADSTRADDSRNTFGLSDYILRDARADICADCHATLNNQRHHPVDIGFTMPASGAALYLENVGSGANTLECSTCHTNGGAHNWKGRGAINLDASWKPSQNARASTYNINLGKTCMDCHNYLTASFRWSPTKNNGVTTVVSTVPGTESYQLHGNATHYIGEVDPRGRYSATGASYWTSLTGGLGAWMNPQSTSWSGLGGGSGFSRFAGDSTTPVLVCESCHELEPDKNSAMHLLLAPYYEQGNQIQAAPEGVFTRTADMLCNGCHVPKGTHQMTNDIVGRSGAALNTDAASIAWLASPSSGPAMGAIATDYFTCDSCHQVHDAPAAGATFILDISNTALDATGQVLAAGTTAAFGATYATPYDTKTTMVKYQRFCDKCHKYN